jgi:cytochrome P450
MTLLELAQHPDKQQRLREEITALGREPTYEDLTASDTLPYLNAVVKECRLRFKKHQAKTKKTIQIGTTQVPPHW